MIANQEITCDKCEARFDITMLPAVKLLNMRCPTCSSGTCQVVNLSRKYGDMLETIRPELLLPETELNILLTLHNEEREMVASEIAGELDCSGQLVGRRAKNLAERSLINRTPTSGVFKYEITPEAESAYFADLGTGDLNVNISDEDD